MIEIVEVEAGPELARVRELFTEYWDSFGFTPCFQSFGDELASLPGKYVRPGGALGLLRVDGQDAGCVALRRFDADRAEFKRLYVRPSHRGKRLGRVLLDWVIGRAKEMGYRELLADTMPEMRDALAMYDRAGFERTAPYSSDPTPGAVYLRLKLAT